MARLNDFGAVDLTNVEEWGGEWKPLPEGEYKVAITSANIDYGKTSQKPYLKLVYTVLEGDFFRRKIFDNFSLWIEKAIVAQKRYKSLRTAIGVNPNDLGDTDELLNKEFCCVVGLRDRYGREGEKENFVNAYKALAATRPYKASSPARAASRAETSTFTADVSGSDFGDEPW